MKTAIRWDLPSSSHFKPHRKARAVLLTGVTHYSPPGPGVHIGRGHPALWKVEVDIGSPKDVDGLTSSLMPEKVMVPSELYFGETPRHVAQAFYDRLGAMWREYISLPPDQLRTPAAQGLLIREILDLLRLVSPAAGIAANHDAHKTLIAAREHLGALTSPSPPRARYSHVIRSYAVSYVRQGHGKVVNDDGRTATKDEVRQLVLDAMTPHQLFARRNGVSSIDGLRDWERGRDISPLPEQIDLHLPERLTRSMFVASASTAFEGIAAIARPFTTGG